MPPPIRKVRLFCGWPTFRAASSLRIVGGEIDPEVGRGRDRDRAAHRLGVPVVILAVEHRILDIAVALGVERSEADGEALADRTGDRAAQLHLVVGAVGGKQAGVELIARPAGDEAQGAADRVLAVERALRAAQHLDPLQVEQVELGASDAAVIDAVDIDADRRVEGLQRVRLTDAANEDVGGVGGAAALDDVEVRHRALQAGRVGRLDAVEAALREGADRGRHALQILLGAAGGDGHFLVGGAQILQIPGGHGGHRGRLVVVLREGRTGISGEGDDRGGQFQCVGHDVSPHEFEFWGVRAKDSRSAKSFSVALNSSGSSRCGAWPLCSKRTARAWGRAATRWPAVSSP